MLQKSLCDFASLRDIVHAKTRRTLRASFTYWFYKKSLCGSAHLRETTHAKTQRTQGKSLPLISRSCHNSFTLRSARNYSRQDTKNGKGFISTYWCYKNPFAALRLCEKSFTQKTRRASIPRVLQNPFAPASAFTQNRRALKPGFICYKIPLRLCASARNLLTQRHKERQEESLPLISRTAITPL